MTHRALMTAGGRRTIALCLALAACAADPRGVASKSAVEGASPRVVLDHPRVRAVRTTGETLAGSTSGPAVIVSLADGPDGAAGRALWLDDVQAPGNPRLRGDVVLLQPLRAPASDGAPAAGWRPGTTSSDVLSFSPIFVSVLRARMHAGALEGLHTHGADMALVHLSGGRIEDTAAGRTVVHTWSDDSA